MTEARDVSIEIACAVRNSLECPCVVNDEPCKDCLENADAILTALRKAGFAMVPKTPTKEMLEVAALVHKQIPPQLLWSVYLTMVAAAQGGGR